MTTVLKSETQAESNTQTKLTTTSVVTPPSSVITAQQAAAAASAVVPPSPKTGSPVAAMERLDNLIKGPASRETSPALEITTPITEEAPPVPMPKVPNARPAPGKAARQAAGKAKAGEARKTGRTAAGSAGRKVKAQTPAGNPPPVNTEQKEMSIKGKDL